MRRHHQSILSSHAMACCSLQGLCSRIVAEVSSNALLRYVQSSSIRMHSCCLLSCDLSLVIMDAFTCAASSSMMQSALPPNLSHTRKYAVALPCKFTAEDPRVCDAGSCRSGSGGICADGCGSDVDGGDCAAELRQEFSSRCNAEQRRSSAFAACNGHNREQRYRSASCPLICFGRNDCTSLSDVTALSYLHSPQHTRPSIS